MQRQEEMNSEVLKDIVTSKSTFAEKERERLSKLEGEVESKGELAMSFMKHPYWQIFDKDLEKLKDDLNAKLLSGYDLKKSQMDRIIQVINMVELFRRNPKGYIDKMRLLVDRRRKSIKEK